MSEFRVSSNEISRDMIVADLDEWFDAGYEICELLLELPASQMAQMTKEPPVGSENMTFIITLAPPQ